MEKRKSTNLIVRNEFRSLTNGLSAFSMATLLLILQGSLGEFAQNLVIAALFFVAAIPVCVTASLVSFLFANRDDVPRWADLSLDWFMNFGWAMAIVGFFFLMGEAGSLLLQVFMGAIAVSLLFFVAILYSLKVREKKQRKPGSQSAVACEDMSPVVQEDCGISN